MLKATTITFGKRFLTTEISSIGDLIAALLAKKTTDTGAIWYRGQSDASWRLLPSLLRQANAISESSLLTRFKQSAAMLASHKPESSFDWIFLMQHYGVPTRLLDWTENPLVATYFAVENRKEEDAAVWLLHPNRLNTNAHISDKDEADYIPSFDDVEVQGYSTERVRLDKRMNLLPIAAIATRNNPRIQAQLGTFTIHHNAVFPHALVRLSSPWGRIRGKEAAAVGLAHLAEASQYRSAVRRSCALGQPESGLAADLAAQAVELIFSHGRFPFSLTRLQESLKLPT